LAREIEAAQVGAWRRCGQVPLGRWCRAVATVTIVDEQQIWFRAWHGLDGVTELGREPGLCASAILQMRPTW
jgi:sigma-B regulation protein RsbU (phosphoserine phosphatase)